MCNALHKIPAGAVFLSIYDWRNSEELPMMTEPQVATVEISRWDTTGNLGDLCLWYILVNLGYHIAFTTANMSPGTLVPISQTIP